MSMFGKDGKSSHASQGDPCRQAEQGGVLKRPEASTAIRAQEGGASAHADPDRIKRLDELERKVSTYQMAWAIGGPALLEILESGLYLLRGVGTFDDYLEERGIKPSTGHDLVRAGRVQRNIENVTHRLSQRAALKLSRLKDPEQAPCLLEAFKISGNRRPSAKQIAEAIAILKPKKATTPRRRLKLKKAKKERLPLESAIVWIKPKKAGVDLRSLGLATLIRELEQAWAKLTAPKPKQAA